MPQEREDDADSAGARSSTRATVADPEPQKPGGLSPIAKATALVSGLGAFVAALVVLVNNCHELGTDVRKSVTPSAAATTEVPTAAPTPLPTPEQVVVPYYGTLDVGGRCDTGQHTLKATWNCDADRTKRVHCQNDMVVTDHCPTRCLQHKNGEDDECE